MELPSSTFELHTDYGEELRVMYSVLIHNLRLEAAHLSLTTLQELLIERIAFNYVAMRHKEANGGFESETAQRNLNTFWLSMTQEFDRQIHQGSAVEREGLVLKFAGVVRDVIASLDDDDSQSALRTSFGKAFERANL